MRRLHRRRDRIEWDHNHFLQLECSHDYFGGAWGNEVFSINPPHTTAEDREEILADMQDCWETHREQIEADYASRHSLSKCWAWWQFNSPDPPDSTKPEWWTRNAMGWPYRNVAPEYYQLLQLGVVTGQSVREGPPLTANGTCVTR